MFDKITVIGCGLIGSSLLRAISKKKLSKQMLRMGVHLKSGLWHTLRRL